MQTKERESRRHPTATYRLETWNIWRVGHVLLERGWQWGAGLSGFSEAKGKGMAGLSEYDVAEQRMIMSARHCTRLSPKRVSPQLRKYILARTIACLRLQ